MLQDQILLNDWHVIARSPELQPGTVLHKRLLGEDLILWHNGDKVLAWQDFCPHRGARLSLGYVNKDTLVSPYWLMVNSAREVPVEVYLDIQNQAASQDIAIVESQQPRRLPLNLQTEIHLPSDRYSIAYRKWLKQQGVTFGTI